MAKEEVSGREEWRERGSVDYCYNNRIDTTHVVGARHCLGHITTPANLTDVWWSILHVIENINKYQNQASSHNINKNDTIVNMRLFEREQARVTSLRHTDHATLLLRCLSRERFLQSTLDKYA